MIFRVFPKVCRRLRHRRRRSRKRKSMGSETGFRRTAAKTIRAVSAPIFPFSLLKVLKKVQNPSELSLSPSNTQGV